MGFSSASSVSVTNGRFFRLGAVGCVYCDVDRNDFGVLCEMGCDEPGFGGCVWGIMGVGGGEMSKGEIWRSFHLGTNGADFAGIV